MYVGPFRMMDAAETVHVILDENGDYTYRTTIVHANGSAISVFQHIYA